MFEGNGRDALDGEPQRLVTCLECGRDADAEEAQHWGYIATGPRAIYRLCPACAEQWRPAGAPPSKRNADFELSWLTPPTLACAMCGTEIAEEDAQIAGWAYWSDAARKFHAFCPDCAAREFGHRT